MHGLRICDAPLSPCGSGTAACDFGLMRFGAGGHPATLFRLMQQRCCSAVLHSRDLETGSHHPATQRASFGPPTVAARRTLSPGSTPPAPEDSHVRLRWTAWLVESSGWPRHSLALARRARGSTRRLGRSLLPGPAGLPAHISSGWVPTAGALLRHRALAAGKPGRRWRRIRQSATAAAAAPGPTRPRGGLPSLGPRGRSSSSGRPPTGS